MVFCKKIDFIELKEIEVQPMEFNFRSQTTPLNEQISTFSDTQSPFISSQQAMASAMPVNKLGETLESEILEIIKLWKYILNLITNIKEDFEVSCRLMKKLARETFNHHTSALPSWLQEIMGDWYEDLELTLCDKDTQVIGSNLK